MATNIWLKILLNFATGYWSIFSASKRSVIPNSVNPPSTLSEFPLASKITVRNLSYSTSESRLKKEFSNFGEIAEVKLVKDEVTSKSKGYAFIQYTNQDEAMEALESMDEKNFDGRVIFVDLAKPSKNFSSSCPKTCGLSEEEAEPYY